MLKIPEFQENIHICTPYVDFNNYKIYEAPSWFTTKKQTDVSVIIPLHKSKKVITHLINSLSLIEDNLKLEYIFVDDGCPHSSKDIVLNCWKKRNKKNNEKEIGKIIHSPTNYGFSAACIAGYLYAQSDILIFLNADVVVEPNWIKPIWRLLQNKKIGVVGNMQLKYKGKHHGHISSVGSEWCWDYMNFEHIGRDIYQGKKLAQPFTLKNCPYELMYQIREVDMVTGCCLGIRKELFKNIGGFDIRYKIGYWEDSDLCMQVKEWGYKIVVTPYSRIWHWESHAKIHDTKYSVYHINKNIFINKWVKSGRIDRLLEHSKKRNVFRVPKKILISKANMESGDILVSLALIKGIKKRYKNAKIGMYTNAISIASLSPYVDQIINSNNYINTSRYDMYISLDNTLLKNLDQNILYVDMKEAGLEKEELDFSLRYEKIDGLPEKYITFHTYNDHQYNWWLGRKWPNNKFDYIIGYLEDMGYPVICVGGEKNYYSPYASYNMINKTNTKQLVYLIKNATMHLGIDSLPFHIAQFVDTPSVCFFGSVKPETRIYKDIVTPVYADIPCIGCFARKKPYTVFVDKCEIETLDCQTKVTEQQMLEAVLNTLEKIENNEFKRPAPLINLDNPVEFQ